MLLIDKIIQSELFSHPDRKQAAGKRLSGLDGTEGHSVLIDDEHAFAPLDGPGVEAALINFRATVPVDVAQVFFGQPIPDALYGRLQKGLFTRIDRGAQFALDAAGATARFKRTAEACVEKPTLDEDITDGDY
jgi:hypothetical protein